MNQKKLPLCQQGFYLVTSCPLRLRFCINVDSQRGDSFGVPRCRGKLNFWPESDFQLQDLLPNRLALLDALLMRLSSGTYSTVYEVVKQAGFATFRRASQTPFNLVFEARP